MKRYAQIGAVMAVVSSGMWVLDALNAGRFWAFFLGIMMTLALLFIEMEHTE
ncbi:MAG: hypothetical protein IPO08_23280 [Xanthomonadales bacterium]|nr:hypothetical protein [Xanthomonadales bacterium]